MRMLSLASLLLLSVRPQEEARTCPAGNLLREWRGQKTGVPEEGYYILRDGESWTAFWKAHSGEVPPRVDFEHEMVVAIFPKEQLEIGWVRVTNVGRPGLSEYWVGMCPSPKRTAFHIAVVGRSDLDVRFWRKDESLQPEPGKEPVRGGFAIEPKLTHGTRAVWAKRLPKLTDDEKKEAEFYIARLGADDIESRDQSVRGLLRMGPKVRPLLAPVAVSGDAEARTRARLILEQLPTFESTGPLLTREASIFAAREHLALHYPTQFSNDPQMRWQDEEARYSAGPHWEIRLKYL